MSETIALLLEFTGLLLLVLGYRKNNRNLMLAAALCLWLGADISDFVRGWLDAAGGG